MPFASSSCAAAYSGERLRSDAKASVLFDHEQALTDLIL